MAIYIFLLPIIFLLLIQGLAWIKFLPYKIKAISFIVITAMIFRYISILIMLLLPIWNIYICLKFLFFKFDCSSYNGVHYIVYFYKKNNIKFYYIFIISIVLTLMYVFIMYNCKVVLQSVKESVYTLVFTTYIYILDIHSI